MNKLNIYSIFPSVEGEVSLYGQGRLTTFIRFAECNLTPPCKYCDTTYALKKSSGTEMTVQQVFDKVKEIGIPKVTITGGEPLLQSEGFYELTKKLYWENYRVSVETNGTLPCVGYGVGSWIVDYKLPSSGCMDKMNLAAFENLRGTDYVKFVIEDETDFLEALNFKEWLQIRNNVHFAFSPSHGNLSPDELISWLMKEKVYDAILNVQLHKVLNLKEEK
jgi:7-carboxy-7-deazaguanine synthase